ncbi:MAG: PIN domain-containing protein [Bacteroidota bacterium]
MTVIVDANILISAILNPKGKISEILRYQSNKIDFAAPLFIKDEVNSHQKRLSIESGMSTAYFSDATRIYYNNILFFSVESIDVSDIEAAMVLTKKIDEKDTLYVALTIALDGVLWTGDMKLYRYLRRNNFMSIVNTKELLNIIKGI